MVEFRVLGGLEISRDSAWLTLPSRRQRALVTRLLLGRGQVVPAAALVDALWEDRPPHDARHALHSHVSRARTLLGPDSLVTRAPGYLLDVPPTAVDAEQFEVNVTRAGELAAQDPATALALLDEALAWWRGPAYAEFEATFARAATARLAEIRLAACEQRAELLLALDRAESAIGPLSELVAERPLRERPHDLLMRALYRDGRQSEALELYQQFRDRLREELGLDPSPDLRRTHTLVLRQVVPEPPRRTEPAAPAATPPAPALTSFVGREDELGQLARLLGTCRIVSIVGPGGVGKTRLAREVAQRLTDRVVWWVDLAPAHNPADVPYRLADALAVPQPADRSVAAFLVDKLRSADGVLVVDNCEHVLPPAAHLLARLAANCPRVVVLATSREPLGVDGEQVLPLHPLPEPGGPVDQLRGAPAVALFAHRLRAAGAPDPTESQLPAVAEICRRLGGLPLAIELAAARASSLGVATVAARPTLDLLAGGSHARSDRHRSLRTVLDWSHDLLHADEQVLFRRLAVFSGWFTLEDVERVCADGSLSAAQIPESLAGLVDKSMVTGPDRERCRLLHPMRAYAGQLLAGHGEDRWLSATYARHVVAFAENAMTGLRGAAERDWAALLAERTDDLRAVHHWACTYEPALALRLAAALSVYARYHMRFELQEWAGAAAELTGTAPNPLRATALASAAAGAWARGNFETAARLAREGLAAADDDTPLTAFPQLVLGDIALLAGRWTEAQQAYQQAARSAGTADPHVACEAIGGQALVRGYRGDRAAARELAAAGERLARERGAPGLMAMARYFTGEVRLTDDPATALELLDESRQLAASAGALLVVGFTIVSSVSARARAGADPVAALANYQEAVEHWRRVGNQAQQWVTLRNLVPALVRAGHDELACVVNAALESAPVRLPGDLALPEADALAAAVAEARQRLGDQAATAAERGARLGMDDLIAAVLTTITTGERDAGAARQAGSSR